MDYYGNKGQGRNLSHWKYIKREKVNGVWKYYYDYNMPKNNNSGGIGSRISNAFNNAKTNVQNKVKDYRYDTNRDGTVGVRERIRGELGDFKERVKDKVTDYRYDTDRDGKVSIGERAKGAVKDKVRDYRYDTNRDGKVSVGERVKGSYGDAKKKVSEKVSETVDNTKKELKKRKYDTNNDGKVGIREGIAGRKKDKEIGEKIGNAKEKVSSAKDRAKKYIDGVLQNAVINADVAAGYAKKYKEQNIDNYLNKVDDSQKEELRKAMVSVGKLKSDESLPERMSMKQIADIADELDLALAKNDINRKKNKRKTDR